MTYFTLHIFSFYYVLVLMQDLYTASLVCGFTQAKKTWKSFELLQKINPNTNSVVFFITQSNCKIVVNQMIQRLQENSEINTRFPIIESASEFAEKLHRLENNLQNMIDYIGDKNAIFVDFWHTNKMNSMIEIIKKIPWKNSAIVIDECDQGGYNGWKKRLEFLQYIHTTFDLEMRFIFITASVANLSNNTFKIAQTDPDTFTHGIIHEIIHTPCVGLYYVKPSDTYVGPSYFIDNDEKIKQIIFRKKNTDEPEDSYKEYQDNLVFEKITNMPDQYKKISLFVFTNKIEQMREKGERLLSCGFNIIVLLNSENSRNYNVLYKNEENQISEWSIPFTELEIFADKKKLAFFQDKNRTYKKTGINSKNDLHLPEVLQASLLINTQEQTSIYNSLNFDQIIRLKKINQFVCDVVEKTRPMDYPISPKIAIVGGNIIGRGITLQNPSYNFTFTSSCIINKKDIIQKGATNSQKFGRLCGNLKHVYQQNTSPCIISTNDVLFDAHINEKVLDKKVKNIPNGTLVCLKDFIDEHDWKLSTKNTSKILKEKRQLEIQRRPFGHQILSVLMKHPEGLSVKDIKTKYPILFEDIYETRHGKQLNLLKNEYKYIEKIDKKYFLTNHGKNQLHNIA